MLALPSLIAAICLCIAVAPGLVTMTCGLQIALQVWGLGIRTMVPRQDVRARLMGRSDRTAVFSVHVATHNEPPALVIATLQALAAQDVPTTDYEVIVIDNNTTDPALWEPVQAFCDTMGPPFRFLHRTGVIGAKAGALNIALAQARPDATHIVTVDADYRVCASFLSRAAEALRLTDADYVQFPQAYAGCGHVAAGIDAELAEYFRRSALIADLAKAVLLTGTLSVISVPALQAAGGWSGRTVTEDADLGVTLCRMGFNGRFIGQVVGRGVLPFSLLDLERQRHRWASGNLQTLIAHGPALFSARGGLSWHQRAAIVSQLTAWLNLSLLPAVALLVGLATGWGGATMALLASFAILLSLADIVGRLLGQSSRTGASPRTLAAAICHRVALSPVAACATMAVLTGQSQNFAVTDKSGTARDGGDRLPRISIILFAAATTVLPQALASGSIVTGAVLLLMAPLPAAWATSRTLSLYRQRFTTPLAGVTA